MWSDLLRDNAAGYARVAMTNIEREFPSAVRYLWTGPDDRPPRQVDRIGRALAGARDQVPPELVREERHHRGDHAQ